MNAEQLVTLFENHYPNFRERWKSDGNVHRDGDAYTAHGVCAEFADFFIEHALRMEPERAEALFRIIESHIANDPTDKDVTANALCTCFLENIAQTEAGEAFKGSMRPVSRKYFEVWHATP